MSNFKVNLTHEQEEQIAVYCAKKNIEFNQANAYEVTLEAFKDTPIIYKTIDRATDEEVEHNVTTRVARYIECQIKTVDRIYDKILLTKEKLVEEQRKTNIKKAKVNSAPNLRTLTENLYKLNIVDSSSYLALICFLMQLKYTRDNQFVEDDKSCVFFNGVPRNGKSATAKAICEVESQYGEVFCAKSGKILESTHEERVWRSHLNFFDEVKPTDIDRELLLNIVNGGEVELNPKNKKQYIYNVNTNNIFTSNDQISLKQRRVSVVKFGNKLNGRPLEVGTLKKIVTNIMDSLPSFERYYELYNIIKDDNENRLNPLAVESIITFLSNRFGFVKDDDDITLRSHVSFTRRDIYNCIKGVYNKQMISSERKESIMSALEHLIKRGLVQEIEYENSTNRNFRVHGENYLKIMHEFDKVNTANEENLKISMNELHDMLQPYFIEPQEVTDDSQDNSQKVSLVLPTFQMDSKVLKLIDEDIYKYKEFENDRPISLISEDIQQKGTQLYYRITNQFRRLFWAFDGYKPSKETMMERLQHLITEEVCQYIRLETLISILKRQFDEDSFDESMVTDLYVRYTRIDDEEVREIADSKKFSDISTGLKDGVLTPQYASYYKNNYKIVLPSDGTDKATHKVS